MLNQIDFDTIFLAAIGLVSLAIILDFSWLGRKLISRVPLLQKLISPAKLIMKKVGKGKISLSAPEFDRQQEVISPASKTGKLVNILWRTRYIYVNVLLVGCAYFLLAQAWMPAPRIVGGTPISETNWGDYTIPVEIYFNVPIDTSRLVPRIVPEQLTGTWQYEPYFGIKSLTRKATFYPLTTLLPNQRIGVYMTGVARSWVNEAHEHAHNFFAPKQPEIIQTSPLHRQENVAVDSEVTLTFSRPLGPSAQWNFQVEPATEYEQILVDEGIIRLKFKEELRQGTLYTLSAFRTSVTYNTQALEVLASENPELVHQIAFTTVKEPLINTITPSGTGVLPETIIRVEFDLPMVQEGVEGGFSITPALEGTLEWLNERTFTYTPTAPMPKETEYTLSFTTGLATKFGGITEREIVHKFTTIGAIQVVQITPAAGLSGVNRHSPNITVLFDQDVDHASAQQHFSISPGVNGSFSWDGNKLLFIPSGPLDFSTTYTISISPGIISVAGLDGRDTFSSAFTTNSNITLIPGLGAGAIDLQDYHFTCGVASAKMILTWKGISISEDGIIARMGQDGTSMDCTSGTCYWGDPNRNYLGFGNGSGTFGTGMSAYGVHWLPIMNVYSQLGIQTELRRNWNTTGLAETLQQGHPVQIWWWNGLSYYLNMAGGSPLLWYDRTTGQPVNGLNGMHSILVVGFYGDPGNPTSFIVLDPVWGYQVYSIAKFNAQWPALSNTGVIIY